LKSKFTIGTRGSRLALWQTDYVKIELEKRFPQARFEVRVIKTTGDAILDTALSKIGDKGLFTTQIEDALLSGKIDLAVHSLKDLPTTQPVNLKIGAVSKREMPNDAFISTQYSSLEDLPKNAKIGTGSLRRKSQLLHFRPDLEVVEIRGNVPTRIEKFLASDLGGIILAFAGVHRLHLDAHIKQIIPTDIMLPAVGQGAMAVEIRNEDSEIAAMMPALNDETTEACVEAERAFLRSLEGGCQVPIGGFAVLEKGKIFLQGFVGSLNGEKIIRDSTRGRVSDAENLGRNLAEKCLRRGAAEILDKARKAAQKSVSEVV
jgi:hydroxymethylbilane synthase